MYRADVPYWGASPRSQRAGENESATEGAETEMSAEKETSDEPVKYKLQTMKWGLFRPFYFCIK